MYSSPGLSKMPAYERIKSTCLQRRVLWEDPDFPATQHSVFYHQKPPFHFDWKRPKDIYANPKFIIKDSESFDVIPGKLGDKWLVSCLGVLYLSKGLFRRMVPVDQRIQEPYAGIFRFRLWWSGEWQEVLVDDRLPTVNNRLAFLQARHTDELWPALLEKAYAKLHGSYEALKYGTLLDGLADLTGGISEALAMSVVGDVTSFSAMFKSTSVITAYYNPPTIEDKADVLELEMNYRVDGIYKVETPDGPVHLVRLQRPLAPGKPPISHVIMDDKLWKSIPLIERENLTTSPNGFWMLYSDFKSAFTKIEMVHLDGETSKAESVLADKQKWHMSMHQGGWRKGVSAGGCRNFVNFFHTNPQVQLTLTESDTVIIALNQYNVMDPKVIGFSVYKTPKPMTGTASPQFFKKMRSTVNSQYTNSRHVSRRCTLEAGTYVVVPTTFEPRHEANFTLRTFSTKPLKLKILDNAPQMLKPVLLKAPPNVDAAGFEQYEGLFLQMADERRTINSFELQDLLEMCLPNDYIKSCASIDTCRQIVLSLDNNVTGRISLSDFKNLMYSLKHWQQVFQTHAVEKMGVLRAERFRDALREVGFVMPERVMSLLILRYMRKDGMLRFGDFVSAIVHLHRAFSMFYTNNPHNDSINLDLSEWLKCALKC